MSNKVHVYVCQAGNKKDLDRLDVMIIMNRNPREKWNCYDWKLMVTIGSRHLRPAQLSDMPEKCLDSM